MSRLFVPVPDHEDMEISTQILMRECFQRDIEVIILDRKEQFLLLRKGNHSEFVKEASKTRLDSYITFLAMENKVVSKFLLKEAGIRVPQGESYTEISAAKRDYEKFRTTKKVIKPTTTNFGLGVQILDKDASEEEFLTKLKEALGMSSTAIVEEYIPGPEYRFLVIGGVVQAVCNRVPANVVGDGQKTIQELVAIKNADPRRGEGHTTPLEKIQLGSVEREVLSSQGLHPSSQPELGKTVYLRKNSNISTGGDSVDKTDEVHPGFKEIATRAARSAQAAICGVDIISVDFPSPPDPKTYAVLEINFNPVLYIHEYPYSGESRRVGTAILDLLGF